MTSPSWRPGKRVAIIGGGPGGISTGLAFLKRGYDVQIFERQPTCKGIGGGVLLSVPVLAVLRSYGLSPEAFGATTPITTTFTNHQGLLRSKIPFNPDVERRMGIRGWHYGVLRASAFQIMLDSIPDGVVQNGHEFDSYTERDNEVDVTFKTGAIITADIVVGADGIRSGVSRQALREPNLFHAGVRVYLAWCDPIPGVEPTLGVLAHDRYNQASYFPMVHDGKPGFEWWTVERSWEGKPVPEDIKAHVSGIVTNFTDPMPRFIEATDFDKNVFRWEIYNRKSLTKWSKGRIVCVGDAVHPVSPYAAYGMGMAIEDGYYLARALDGVDLTDLRAVNAGFEIYEKERVPYANHNVEFARFMGHLFHALPWPLTWIRDLIFNYSSFFKSFMARNYIKKSEEETLALTELQVD